MGGSSWGNSGWSSNGNSGSRGGWGTSTWGNNGNNPDPEGTHNNSCIAGTSGWGNSGFMTPYYDEKCPGCRHDRSKSSWTNRKSGGNPTLQFCALFGVGAVAKKSLWD